MFCSRCGKENKDDANFCKHCGAGLGQNITLQGKGKMTRTKRILLLVGIIAAVLVISAIGVCLIIGHRIEEQREALEIINSSMTYDELGYAEVTGRVRNNGDFKIPGSYIKAKFYDSEDTLIDTGFDFLAYIGAGEQAQFTILYSKQGAVRYEVYVA